MKKQLTFMRRSFFTVVAAVLAVTGALPALFDGTADAAQMTSRSIQISDSNVSGGTITAGIGSGTNVVYKVTFNVSNTATAIGGVAIDFCSNSPLIGDSCTAPTGFDANSATLSVNNISPGALSGMTVYTTTPVANRVIITRGTAAAPSANPVTFELGDGTTNGITNPTVSSPLYARIYTYATAAAAQGHNTGSPTGYTDFGGIALNINTFVSITARVQESLTFCASGTDISGNTVPGDISCAEATAPNLTLGHGGPPAVLDSTAVDTASAYTQLSTNATSGAIIRMRATNTCAEGGLSKDGGTTCNIEGIPTANGVAPVAIVAGTAAFGLFVSDSSLTTGVSTSQGTVTPDANYNDGTNETIPGGLTFGMDRANVTSTYGDAVASSAGPVSRVNNQLVFGATASLTTQAGIYTGNELLIATGTF